MLNVLKYIWRFLMRICYKRKNVILHSTTVFNQKTTFGGYNKIGKGSSVSDSKIGKFTYISSACKLENCTIGNFCSIGTNVNIVTQTHPSHLVSTSPVFYSSLNQCNIQLYKKSVIEENLLLDGKRLIVGNDVWIGNNVTFVGAHRVGDGAIIAYGAVVTKDVPPFSIVGGVPARQIKKRFDENVEKQIRDSNWWNKSNDWILSNYQSFLDIQSFFKNIKRENS